jgi:hypothetical protein
VKIWRVAFPDYQLLFHTMTLLIPAIIFCNLLLLSFVGCIELSHNKILPLATTGPSAGQPGRICWGNNETHIEVQLCYPTQGWLAMGLSPNGGMDQTDVLFGYVDDQTNEVVVQDRWLTANLALRAVNLSLDAHQNWQIISGSQNATHTMIRAVRKLKTCDPQDRPFLDTAQPTLYSYNFKDPESKTAPIHMHNVRGSFSINFLEPEPIATNMVDTEVTKLLTFTVDKVNVTGALDTEYWCSITRIPPLDRKYHSIMSQPLINPKNIKNIHHMLVYSCDNIPEQLVKDINFQCAPTQSNFLMKYCVNLIGGWAMGAPEIKYMPKDVGQPFTPEMSGTYVVVQVHYNNPNHEQFVDDSGIKYSLTDKIRKYDSGAIMAGVLSLDFTFTMPPGQPVFQMRGQCSDQCTTTINPEGITIYSSLLHMHTRGKAAVVRHFRGNKELPILAINTAYDFNFQSSNPVNPPRLFLPGDRIMVECNFTTANEKEPIYGGEGTSEEMCLAFLSYYPKSDLKTCGILYKLDSYLEALRMASPDRTSFLPHLPPEAAIALITGTSNQAMLKRKIIQMMTEPIHHFIADQTWTPQNTQVLQNFYSGVNYDGCCIKEKNITIVTNDQPPNVPTYVYKPDDNC